MFYSIIADEVTDIANREQLSLVLRYVINGKVKEVFTDFLELERITGEALADAILKTLETWGLPVANMRGQCYDGGSNMAGAKSGCRAIVQRQAPMSIYVHCASHRLNLAIVSACKIQAFKNTESCVGEIARFFRFSLKRQRYLERAIDLVCPEATAKKLKDACRTRWIERIDSYAVHACLQAMIVPTHHFHTAAGGNWNWDGETLTKANGFLYQLQSSSFLLCFKILLEFFTVLRCLSTKLQMRASSVLCAYSQVCDVIADITTLRDNSDQEFKRIFDETTELGKHLHGQDFELSKPRVNRRQVYRSNVGSEEYYRITLYHEFMSHALSQLKERFLDSPLHGLGLLHLLPNQCQSTVDEAKIPDDLLKAVDFYNSDLPHPVLFPSEYRNWVRKWKRQYTNLPNNLVGALEACDVTAFPNLEVLLRIALTIPITSCESERSFSQLKLIKTCRRSNMLSSRLSGHSLMKINRDRCEKLQQCPVKLRELVQAFYQLHPRRIKLPFMLAD